MNLKKFIINLLIITFAFSSFAEEKVLNNRNTEFSVFTGMFDFSDDGKKSTLIGFQHQNENLNRDTFFGNISPITGALITADNPKPFGIQSSAWSLPSNADNSKWYHQALVMDSGTARGYYDGNAAGTKSYTSYTLPGNVRAGGRNSYIWDGQIACFAIYNVALSHADIKQIYNAQKNRFGL